MFHLTNWFLFISFPLSFVLFEFEYQADVILILLKLAEDYIFHTNTEGEWDRWCVAEVVLRFPVLSPSLSVYVKF